MRKYLQPHFYILYLAKEFLMFDRLRPFEYFSAYVSIWKSIGQELQKRCIDLLLINDQAWVV